MKRLKALENVVGEAQAEGLDLSEMFLDPDHIVLLGENEPDADETEESIANSDIADSDD